MKRGLGDADGACIIAFRDHRSNRSTSNTITIAG